MWLKDFIDRVRTVFYEMKQLIDTYLLAREINKQERIIRKLSEQFEVTKIKRIE